MRWGAVLLLLVGLLALTEVVLTITWQEPISALSAHRRQQALGDDLAKTERALRAPSSLERMATMRTQQRIAALAERLGRRTTAGDALGRILIPEIEAKFVFVAGAGQKSLKKGPAHYDSTVLPGQRGTVGIAGHRTTYLAPFRKLGQLQKKEQIVLTMPYGRFTYVVERSFVVSPSDDIVLRRVNRDRLVLTTCTPAFSAAKRLVVTARKKSQVPLGAALANPLSYAF